MFRQVEKSLRGGFGPSLGGNFRLQQIANQGVDGGIVLGGVDFGLAHQLDGEV